jgi:hypothetical protein
MISETTPVLLRDALARIVRARDAIEVGEFELAALLLADLECDLAAALGGDAS